MKQHDLFMTDGLGTVLIVILDIFRVEKDDNLPVFSLQINRLAFKKMLKIFPELF